MKVHPLILAHGQTYDRKFPLILIIGREPNNNSISNGNKGLMDFAKHPRCAFWNVAFSVYGTINNSQCREMKQIFVQRKAAPLLLADAFPQGIHNAESDKNSIRINQVQFANEQVNSIFAHADLMERVHLILLSGQTHSMFDNFRQLVKERSQRLGIIVKEIPFLYPTNTPKIHAALSEQDKDLIRSIHNSFTRETDDVPELPIEQIKRYEVDDSESEFGIVWE